MVKPTQPIGRFDDASGQWVLVEPWECRLSGGRTLYLRPGLVSDGASIPRFLWPVVGPRYAPRTFPAALAHDALYMSELLSREQADAEFRRLLVMYGVSYSTSTGYWLAVRLFGWAVWDRHTKDSIAIARAFVTVENA